MLVGKVHAMISNISQNVHKKYEKNKKLTAVIKKKALTSIDSSQTWRIPAVD